MFEYAVTKTQSDDSFSISILKDGKTIKELDDVALLKTHVFKFAELCNKNQISPIHFDDALENFLTDFETL